MTDPHRIHVRDLRQQQAQVFAKKPNKFGAKPQTYNDRWYASKAEMLRAEELDLLVHAGDVEWWIPQPIFLLPDGINKYTADFLVFYLGIPDSDWGACWVEEVKGRETTAFRKNVKLWEKHGPMPLHILKRKGGRWETTIIEPRER